MSRQLSWARRRLAVVPAVLALSAPAAAGAAVPIPTVTGPLPSSEASHPFGGAAYQLVPEDLSKSGYVEEEYYVSGLANVYTRPAPGRRWCARPNAPYTTRILVRRPADPAKSSGNAVVEMLNPSNNIDLNIGWAIMQKQFMRKGDTWIGITIRPVAVDALKQFDPSATRRSRSPTRCRRPAAVHGHRRRGRPGARSGLGHEQPGRRVVR